MTLMKISQAGLDLIKQYEGCKLYAYRDSVGVATIGYGHTKDVRMGMAITQQQADRFLMEDCATAEKTLNNLGINMKQCQFDALCSWIFNLGVGNFLHSTMLIRMQTGASDEDVTDQMVKWCNAGGKPLTWLMRRRCAEANMFLGCKRYWVAQEKKTNTYKIVKQ